MPVQIKMRTETRNKCKLSNMKRPPIYPFGSKDRSSQLKQNNKLQITTSTVAKCETNTQIFERT